VPEGSTLWVDSAFAADVVYCVLEATGNGIELGLGGVGSALALSVVVPGVKAATGVSALGGLFPQRYQPRSPPMWDLSSQFPEVGKSLACSLHQGTISADSMRRASNRILQVTMTLVDTTSLRCLISQESLQPQMIDVQLRLQL